MDRELIDRAWACLPREFKEEVKQLYKAIIEKSVNDSPTERYFDGGYEYAFEKLFGKHNLTSDAEGEEDEMLYVSRERVQKMYARYDKICNDPNRPKDYIESVYEHADGVTMALDDLFDSKCLPDETPLSQNPSKNCDNESHISNDCNKPAEPKFKVGDKVRYRCDGKIHEVKAKTGKYHYALSGLGHDVHEEYLEPYTEPKETKAEEMADKAIKPVAEHFDNILKNSFSKERRLNIAAQMMQGLICAPLVPGVDPNPPAEYLAQAAFRLADALIAEWRKD